MHVLPGDPFLGEQGCPEEVLRALRAHFGLEQPLLYQLGTFLKNCLSGSLGPSITQSGMQVEEIISSGFPISLTLGSLSLAVSIPLGLWLGLRASMWSSVRQELLLLFTTLGICLPSFLAAPLLQYVFAIRLQWFSIGSWGSPGDLILPTLCLALSPTCVIAKICIAEARKLSRTDFALLAKSRGLDEKDLCFQIYLKHALLALLGILAPISAAAFTGSFIIEKIFALPGLGRHFVHAILDRDYPLIVGTTLFFSVFLIGCNLLCYLLQIIIDPRIAKNSALQKKQKLKPLLAHGNEHGNDQGVDQ